MSFVVRPLVPADAGRLVTFLRKFFLRDEPLNQMMGVIGPGRETAPEQEDFCTASLAQGLSLQAVDQETDSILGVSISCLHEPGHEDEAVKAAEDCPDHRFREILRIIAYVDKQVSKELHKVFPDQDLRQVEVQVLSVDTATRGKGIATTLIDKTRELARQRGIPLVRVDCSNLFSARAVERLGFQLVFSMEYDRYRPHGEPVFSPSDKTHNEYRTYVQKVI